MSVQPDVSVVVLNWNTRDLLAACLESLRSARTPPAFETIVVDNASSDGSADMVALRFPEVRLVRNPRNVGYAAGNNVGIRLARGRAVFLLNSDTEVEADALERLFAEMERDPTLGAVAPRLVSPDGGTQRACMRFPTLMTAVAFDTWFGRRGPLRREMARYFYEDFDHETTRDVEQPPAAALLLRRDALQRVGLLDEDLFLFFNDVDLCRRLRRAGWRIRYLAEARVRHVGGASTRLLSDFALEWHRDRARYYLRAYGLPGFLLAKAMTVWRAAEEWFRRVPRIADPEERESVQRDIERVVREVLADRGRFDERVVPSRQKTSESPIV